MEGKVDADLPKSFTLDGDQWDLTVLEKESEMFAMKASKQIFGKVAASDQSGMIKWIRRLGGKKKDEEIQEMYANLLPRLKNTEQDISLWLSTLTKRKGGVLEQGEEVFERLTQKIIFYERRLDFLDELSNDCRQINFDVSNEMTAIEHVIAFNKEIHIQLINSRSRRDFGRMSKRRNNLHQQFGPRARQARGGRPQQARPPPYAGITGGGSDKKSPESSLPTPSLLLPIPMEEAASKESGVVAPTLKREGDGLVVDDSTASASDMPELIFPETSVVSSFAADVPALAQVVVVDEVDKDDIDEDYDRFARSAIIVTADTAATSEVVTVTVLNSDALPAAATIASADSDPEVDPEEPHSSLSVGPPLIHNVLAGPAVWQGALPVGTDLGPLGIVLEASAVRGMSGSPSQFSPSSRTRKSVSSKSQRSSPESMPLPLPLAPVVPVGLLLPPPFLDPTRSSMEKSNGDIASNHDSHFSVASGKGAKIDTAMMTTCSVFVGATTSNFNSSSPDEMFIAKALYSPDIDSTASFRIQSKPQSNDDGYTDQHQTDFNATGQDLPLTLLSGGAASQASSPATTSPSTDNLSFTLEESASVSSSVALVEPSPRRRKSKVDVVLDSRELGGSMIPSPTREPSEKGLGGSPAASKRPSTTNREVDEDEKFMNQRLDKLRELQAAIPALLTDIKASRNLDSASLKQAKKLRLDLEGILLGGESDSDDTASHISRDSKGSCSGSPALETYEKVSHTSSTASAYDVGAKAASLKLLGVSGFGGFEIPRPLSSSLSSAAGVSAGDGIGASSKRKILLNLIGKGASSLSVISHDSVFKSSGAISSSNGIRIKDKLKSLLPLPASLRRSHRGHNSTNNDATAGSDAGSSIPGEFGPSGYRRGGGTGGDGGSGTGSLPLSKLNLGVLRTLSGSTIDPLQALNSLAASQSLASGGGVGGSGSAQGTTRSIAHSRNSSNASLSAMSEGSRSMQARKASYFYRTKMRNPIELEKYMSDLKELVAEEKKARARLEKIVAMVDRTSSLGNKLMALGDNSLQPRK